MLIYYFFFNFSVIEGWLKQQFAMTVADKATYIIGALTDGKNKINLRFRDASEPEKFQTFQKGEKVKVLGFIDCNRKFVGYFRFSKN